MKSLLFRHFIYVKLRPRARALPGADKARAQSVPWSIKSRISISPKILSVTATGKRVGAVTHVLVNDPTMGYGIFIENMPDAAALIRITSLKTAGYFDLQTQRKIRLLITNKS